jgi:hypothetical protein
MFSPLLSLNLFPVPACELHLLERLTLITSGLFNCVIPLQDPILGLLPAALYYFHRNLDLSMQLRCTQEWTQEYNIILGQNISFRLNYDLFERGLGVW